MAGRPEKYTEEWIAQEAKELLSWIEVDSDKKIYLGSFAKDRGYDRQRLSEFANKSTIFSDAYKKAKQWQEEKFMRNGLMRIWDPAFTAKCMARVCGPEWKNSWDREEEKVEKQPIVYSVDFSNCTITPNGIHHNKDHTKDA